MSDYSIKIVTHSEDLPSIKWQDFFHSPELFTIYERSSGQTPFMVLAMKDNHVKGHLLAVLRRRGSLIPPYLFTQGRVYGEGEYEEDVSDKAELFGLMLEALTQKLKRRLCFYIEISQLSKKMFGYKQLRSLGYLPVNWMEIHNSLHSKFPRDRLDERMLQRIKAIETAEIKSVVAIDEDSVKKVYDMLHRFFTLKVRRYLPPQSMFEEMKGNEHFKLFITKHKEKAIGACVCVFSRNDAYLWFMAAKRKTHASLHPSTATIWGAIQYAYENQCHHIHFMDVGLPYSKNPFRDFILRFGGKEVSSYRWFRFSLTWINCVYGWFLKES